MFWNMIGQFESQAIDGLLDKENVTLIEVLDEDNLVQEVMHRNQKLINYLCKPETLKEMVELVSLDSTYKEVALEETEEYENTQRRFKRANQVSELLNADNEDVGKKLVSDEQLLDILMSILKNDEQLNPLLASFFSKIFGGLLKHHPESTWNYLKNKEDLMDDIIKHMQTLGILDFILRMVTCPSDNEQVRTEIINWMVEEELVEKLIDLLNNEQRMSSDIHTYACTALSDLVRILREGSNGEASSARCPLLNRLTQTSTIEKVIAQMVVSPIDSSVFASAATVLSTFMEPVQKLNLYPWEGESSADIVSYYPSANATVDVLANHVERLHSILQNPPQQSPLTLPFGVLDPPLGKVRLNIVKLISESIPQKTKSFFNALKETDILNTIIKLFFKYDNNSFLSGHFTTIVTEILKGDYDEELIIKHLFDDCALIEKLANAWSQCIEDEKQGLPRKGYMGHLYKVLSLISKYEQLDCDNAEKNEIELDTEKTNRYALVRNKIIKEHISEMNDENQTNWLNLKNDLIKVKELQERDLGKKKLVNSSINQEIQPSSAAEDMLARYQQKISPDFVSPDFNGVEDDDDNDFPSLNNDVIAERDDLLKEVSNMKKEEDLFESICQEQKSDWFNDIDKEKEKTPEEVSTLSPKVDTVTDDRTHDEKMDTSGTPNESPWGEQKPEKTAPPIAAFDAWGQPTNESEGGNTGLADSSTDNGWANFDSADFGRPAQSSSPGPTKTECVVKNEEIKMETDTPSPSSQDAFDNGSGDMSGQKPEKFE